MTDTVALTALKMLAKGRSVSFVAGALDLDAAGVLALAHEHGATRPDGSLDPAAVEAAAAALAARTGTAIPVRQPTEPVAPRQTLSPPTRIPSSPTAPRGGRALPGYVLIETCLIGTDGRNVRSAGPGDVTELAASIAQVGILQPITVRPHGGRYVVDLGHRRFAAAKALGLAEVPCIIRSAGRTDPATMRVERLIENLHRAQLEPLEEAEAFEALLGEGLTQADIARRVGVSSATVSTRLALLALPRDAKAMLRDGRLPLTEAMRLGQQVRARGAGRVHNKAPEQPDYWAMHPLAEEIRRACDHYGRRRYGRVGCGQCIEAVIRSDEGLRLLTNPTTRKDLPA